MKLHALFFGTLFSAFPLAVAAPAFATWPTNGLFVVDAPSPTGMFGDGNGGIFLNWNADKLQRISKYGELYFNPIKGPYLNNVSDAAPCFPDNAGGIYIAARQNSTIVLMHVGAQGQLLWSLNVCQTANTKYALCASADGAGGALVMWSENRNLPSPQDGISVYGQRVAANGTPLWTSDGQRVRWNYDYPPRGVIGVDVYVQAVVPSNPGGTAGGAMILTTESLFWSDAYYVSYVYSTGASGTAVNALHYMTRAVSDGNGGAYTWYDGDSYDGLYLYHFAPLGPDWTTPVCQAAGVQRGAVVCSDAGGALIAWLDERSGDQNIYIQRVDRNGSAKWTANGVPVCMAEGLQYDLDIAQDYHGGAQVVWTDARGGMTDIYTEHIDETGLTIEYNGVQVSHGIQNEVYSRVYRDAAGYSIISWREATGVYARRIDQTVTPVSGPVFNLSLEQNHPNPFNPTTTIDFVLPQAGRARLLVYQPNGEKVRTLFDHVTGAGTHSVRWDGRDDEGQPVSSGIYLYRLTAGTVSTTRKMMLLK